MSEGLAIDAVVERFLIFWRDIPLTPFELPSNHPDYGNDVRFAEYMRGRCNELKRVLGGTATPLSRETARTITLITLDTEEVWLSATAVTNGNGDITALNAILAARRVAARKMLGEGMNSPSWVRELWPQVRSTMPGTLAIKATLLAIAGAWLLYSMRQSDDARTKSFS